MKETFGLILCLNQSMKKAILAGISAVILIVILTIGVTMNRTSTNMLEVGDFAPDFTLRSQHNELVRLSDFRNKRNVVLYFYPKDDTPGCTAEAQCFRDNYEIFLSLGAEVIGISSDSTASHIRFADKHKLPFILLSDVDGKVRELYGVTKTLFFLSGRVTFVIDKQGVVRHIFSSQFNATKHIDEAMAVLKSLD